MKKFFNVTETTMLAIYCFTLIGVMLFEHMIHNAIEIFKSGRK